jgi:hypothetical protein
MRSQAFFSCPLRTRKEFAFDSHADSNPARQGWPIRGLGARIQTQTDLGGRQEPLAGPTDQKVGGSLVLPQSLRFFHRLTHEAAGIAAGS